MGFLPSSAAASIYLFKPLYAIGPVSSLSGHAIAYRWRSLPRARRHRASKPHGSSKRVPSWQVTMGQLICASLSHTQYWYEVDMLKVPTCGSSDSPKTSSVSTLNASAVRNSARQLHPRRVPPSNNAVNPALKSIARYSTWRMRSRTSTTLI